MNNLSTSNFSPAASSYAKSANRNLSDGFAPKESTGGFEDLFAGVAQRVDCAKPAPETPKSTSNSTAEDEVAPGADEYDSGEAEAKVSPKKKPVDDLLGLEAVAQLSVPLTPIAPPSGNAGGEEKKICDPVTGEPMAALSTSRFEQVEPKGIERVAVSSVETADTAVLHEQGAEGRPAKIQDQNQAQKQSQTTGEAPSTDDTKPDLALVTPRVVALDGQLAKADQHGSTAAVERSTADHPEKFQIPEISARTARGPVFGKRVDEPKKAGTAVFAEIGADVEPSDHGNDLTHHKNFLASDQKILTPREEIVGINVANQPLEMPASPASQILDSVFSKHALPVRVDGADAKFAAENLKGTEAPILSTAQRAIEAVLEVSERFTTTAQRAVKMEFSVSGEDLSVHVQMHEGRVRATFQTDSAELRTALAQEWQVLTANKSENSQRFAEPVFSSGSSPSAHNNNGEHLGNHRGQETHQSRENFEFSLRSNSGRSAGTAVLPATPLAAVTPLTALRLHTFA